MRTRGREGARRERGREREGEDTILERIPTSLSRASLALCVHFYCLLNSVYNTEVGSPAKYFHRTNIGPKSECF